MNQSKECNTIMSRGLILCIINSAAYSRSYFEQLTPYLEGLNFEVCFALDSHLTDAIYSKGNSLEDAFYFTDFIKSNLEKLPDIDEQKKYSWNSLFSDFDRFLTLDISPPLYVNKTLSYNHIPPLLKRFFNQIFSEKRPIAVLYEPVSNSFALAAYEQANAAGIPFCSISPSRIPGRIEISTTGGLKDDLELKGILDKGIISKKSLELASTYISTIDEKVPDYMKTNGLDDISLVSKYLRFDKIAHLVRSYIYQLRNPQDCNLAYQHGKPLTLSKAYVKRSVFRRLRFRTVSALYKSAIPKESFLLYPLHYHPEASTSMWAPDYVDELNTITAIAFRLPCHMTLCVKEHPSAVALQPLSFYKRLSALPNIRLLSPNLNTKHIIRSSSGVVTLTSTVGFEAAVLNKPVTTLGNVFYNYFPNVRSVKNYEQLAEALVWMSSYKTQPESEIQSATAAYFEFTTPGSFDFKQSLGQHESLNSVATLINTKLKEHNENILIK